MLSEPIIVLAVPRSGSRFVRTLLNAHPDIYVPAYSELLWEVIDSELSLETVEKLLRYDAQFGSGRTLEHVVGWAQRMIQDFLFSGGERSALQKERASRWGFTFYDLGEGELTLLRTLFPNGTFVHVVRDGRDVVASWLANFDELVQRRLNVEPTPESIASMWGRMTQTAERFCDATIRLEDVVADASACANKLKLLLKLEPFPEVDSLPKIGGGDGSLGRWQRDLSASAQQELQNNAGFTEVLHALKYTY